MRLKLDENLGNAPLDFFLEAGHDATTVGSQQLKGVDDLTRIREYIRE